MVRNSSSGGFSLVELIVSIAIFSTVVGGFSMALAQMFKGLAHSGQSVDQQLSSTLLQTVINRKLAMSTLKSYSLTNSPQADETHARHVAVSPSVCADLSTESHCTESTLLTFTSVLHTDRTVAAYCWVSPGRTLLVEDSIDSLMAADGVTKNLIGLVAAPIMTNWGVKALQPAQFTNADTGAPYAPDCVARLPRETNGKLKFDRFRELTVEGFSLRRVPSTVAPILQAQYNVIFPERIARLNLYTAGLAKAQRPSAPGEGETPTDFQVLACNYDPQTMINCEGSHLMGSVPKIRSNAVIESFSLPMMNASTGAIQWQIQGAEQSRSVLCQAPSCGVMPSASYKTQPFYSSTNESADRLDASSYSLSKQNFISQLRLVLETEKGKSISIHFEVE